MNAGRFEITGYYSEEKQKKYIREIISDFAKIIKDNEYMN